MWRRHKKLIVLLLVLLIPAAIIWAATTFSYTYASAVNLAKTNGYGGGTADLAADQAYDYTSDIDLATNGYYGIWIYLQYDGSGGTDSIIISYFGSPDGTNFDDIELWSVTCSINGGADTQISFLCYPAPPHGRIGVKTSGTTNTFDYQIDYVPFRGSGT